MAGIYLEPKFKEIPYCADRACRGFPMKRYLALLLLFPASAMAESHATVSEDLRSAREEMCQVAGEIDDLGRSKPARPMDPGGTEWLVNADRLFKLRKSLETKIDDLKSTRKKIEREDPSLRAVKYSKESVRCELVKPGTMLCNGQHFFLDSSGKVIEASGSALKKLDGAKAASAPKESDSAIDAK